MSHIADNQRKAMFANMRGGDNKFSYAPVYAPADIPAMGVDAVGTAGSAVVGLVPLAVTLGGLYLGAELVLKGGKKLDKEWHKGKADAKKSRFSRNELISDYYDYEDADQHVIQV